MSINWNEGIAQAYSDGLHQGKVDAERGEDREDELAALHSFSRAFRDGYRHAQDKVRRES
jgi:hypothetical protein